METANSPRHQLIENLVSAPSEKVVEAAMEYWEQLAIQIVSIVGEDGFASLYARSLFLTQPAFPRLADNSLSKQTNQWFAELKKSFEGLTPAQVSKANRLLLITFTDILASLIGEDLTTSILRLAWSSNVYK